MGKFVCLSGSGFSFETDFQPKVETTEMFEKKIRADERTKVIDEIYNLVTNQMIKWNTDLDFNLETQNKILDLKYEQIKEQSK